MFRSFQQMELTMNATFSEILNGTHRDMPVAAPEARPALSLTDVRGLITSLGERCRTVVQGRDETIALILVALLADGHVILEDHPGSGKTTLAKALGDGIARSSRSSTVTAMRRIQFTPDLLPSDITGGLIFEPESRQFIFRPGPIFANVVLADEINRTNPKVQAALLEAMAEKQVTVDNQTHPLHELFFVIATQNPFDLAGTYPLPRAQLDRFMFKIRLTHLARAHELEVLSRWKAARRQPPTFAVTPEAILDARTLLLDAVQVSPVIHECLADLAAAIRKDPRVALGISTRSLVLAIPALQAWAVIQGRDYVTPKDLKTLAVPLFSHRIELAPGFKDADAIVISSVTPIVESVTRFSLTSAAARSI
jgi:MoxR-like ATPase